MENPETNQVPEPVEQAVGEQGTQQDKPQDDLMSRVTSFMETNEPSEPVDNDVQFDPKIKDEIDDPRVREYLDAKEKSLESGWTKKFQEVAELRKALEGKTNEKWTPERIQSLMNDQDFLQAAQSVVQTESPDGVSDEEWSALSDAEKKHIQTLEKKVSFLEQQTQQKERSQLHEKLQSKYKNYDPVQMDTITSEILANKQQITLEDVYKAKHHDENMKNAYELGRKDALSGNEEAYQASSYEAPVVRQENHQPIEAKEGENIKQTFARVAQKVMRQKQLNK